MGGTRWWTRSTANGCAWPTSHLHPASWLNEASAECEWFPPNHILQVTVRAFASADGSQSVAEAVYQLSPAALVTLPGGHRVLYIEPRIN
jgi:hypothetical protein